MPHVPVAQNLSSQGLQRRVGVASSELGEHGLALLVLFLLVLVTPRAYQGMAAATPRQFGRSVEPLGPAGRCFASSALAATASDFVICSSLVGVAWRPRGTAAEGKVVSTIAEWLKSLGMSEYAEPFARNSIDDVSILRDLTDQDLKDVGVPLGHRRKMLRAIAELSGAALAANVDAHDEGLRIMTKSAEAWYNLLHEPSNRDLDVHELGLQSAEQVGVELGAVVDERR